MLEKTSVVTNNKNDKTREIFLIKILTPLKSQSYQSDHRCNIVMHTSSIRQILRPCKREISHLY